MFDESGHDNANLPGSSWNAKTGGIAFVSDGEDTDEIWSIAVLSSIRLWGQGQIL